MFVIDKSSLLVHLGGVMAPKLNISTVHFFFFGGGGLKKVWLYLNGIMAVKTAFLPVS